MYYISMRQRPKFLFNMHFCFLQCAIDCHIDNLQTENDNLIRSDDKQSYSFSINLFNFLFPFYGYVHQCNSSFCMITGSGLGLDYLNVYKTISLEIIWLCVQKKKEIIWVELKITSVLIWLKITIIKPNKTYNQGRSN